MIPQGWYGLVRASGVSIIRRAIIEEEIGRPALASLVEPEASSRSQAFAGRRLARVIDGGFIVLNFDTYRQRDYTTAERSARYRARKKSGRHAVASRDITVESRPVTQAEVEAEVEVEVRSQRSEERERKIAFGSIARPQKNLRPLERAQSTNHSPCTQRESKTEHHSKTKHTEFNEAVIIQAITRYAELCVTRTRTWA